MSSFNKESSKYDIENIPLNIPSLCIPRVFPNINKARISKVFDDLKLGEIDRLDMIQRTSEQGVKFNCVFIHFTKWEDTPEIKKIRESLLNNKEIKVIYDEPWFWKVSAYRQREVKKKKTMPTILLDDNNQKQSTTHTLNSFTKRSIYESVRPKKKMRSYSH
jgi:hypothetical protein